MSGENEQSITVKPKLYLITNDDEFSLLYAKLEQALKTKVISLLQIRRKQYLTYPDGQSILYQECSKIIDLASQYGVDVIINDDVLLAKTFGVGVHLGQGDGEVLYARELLGEAALIGRTCHYSLDLVKKAKQEGASYAALGAVFASQTKPNASQVSLSQIEAACQQDIDVCVIGGIGLDNVERLNGLPINYIALVGDIMNHCVEDIAEHCHQWQHKINQLWLC